MGTQGRSGQILSRRLWALAALLAAGTTVGFAIVVAVIHFPRGLAVLACAGLAVWSAWYAIRRRGGRRAIGAGAAALLGLGALALIILEGDVGADILVVVGLTAALAAARRAFSEPAELPRLAAPDHPVLFFNPLSGGGKAARFHLPEEARRRGIEPVELHRGVDLEQLVRDAARRGADGLAMAGGDGSQAVVATVAAELDLPYACIPAGTRNHFALDLGVDRDDVVGALDAFVSGGERRVDLAEVNGRVFVNNVSLGLYAEAVQRPGYREAKLHTLLDTVPDVLGPDSPPPDLFWHGRSGRESAAVILVSNNRYRLGRMLDSGTRPLLDEELLGVAVLGSENAAGIGTGQGSLLWRQWSAPTFEIQSDRAVPAGIDGEATTLDPPLRFRVRPHSLRVRIAPGHPGESPSAREPDTPWQAITALVKMAFG